MTPALCSKADKCGNSHDHDGNAASGYRATAVIKRPHVNRGSAGNPWASCALERRLRKGSAVMRLVLCVLLLALSPGVAFAAKDTMTLSQAQAAAAKGDSQAAAAIGTTTDQQTCLNECSNRGYDKGKCATACRPGICHPGGEPPYCVAK